jgi:16S rRNA processing protein RimM
MSSSRSNNPPPSSSPASNDPWDLLIGEVTAPYGLKGEVRVYPHTDFPERFEGLRQIGVQRGEGPVAVTKVTAARVTGTRIVLKLDGVDGIDAAEALRGARLYVRRSQAVQLAEDEYFHSQLLGLQVVTTDGEALGPITGIIQTGANDVYETPLALIPAVKDYVIQVDLAGGRMIVQYRPGLKKHDRGE